MFLVVTLLLIYVNGESCNYATFSVETAYSPTLNIGTFSFSTNRCQSLKATLKSENDFLGFGFTLPFDGSFKLQCYQYSKEYYQIAVNLYDDPLCNDLITDDSTSGSDAIWVDMENSEFTIYNSIKFSLDEMHCDSSSDDASCGISMEMANNCSWSQSQRYLNISVPDSHCVSLAPDFNGILNSIPFQIMPTEFVDNLETSSMQFTCCSSDNSLLISNYSDTKCLTEPDSQFRIPQNYNEQCFVIGNEEDIVEDDSLRTYINENSKDSYVYILRWQCNSFEDQCDEKNIPILTDEYLPQKCSDECIENEQEQEANSNKGRRHRMSSSSTDRNKIAGVVAVVGAVIVLFMIIVTGFVCYGRRKAMQRQVEGNLNNNVHHRENKDDKYEAFVSEPNPQDMNIVRVASVDDIN